ncbi:MAG: GIY-YIG nuclease family protein [Candidatus Buchananbacteria bacterium]
MGNRQYYVYLMTNKMNTTLYTGVTNDIQERVYQHKNKLTKGFTSKYNINKLVYYEEFDYIDEAIAREKQIKSGLRKKKVELIESENQKWEDLSRSWY